jgi:membrane glycosyltransferase
MAKEGSSGSAISATTLLGVAFIILKLCKVITWSWIWVLSPFWIGLVLAILLIVIIAVIGD